MIFRYLFRNVIGILIRQLNMKVNKNIEVVLYVINFI